MEQVWKIRKGVVESTERVKERYHDEMSRYEMETEKKLEQKFKEKLKRLAEQVDFKEQQVLRKDRDIDELGQKKAEVAKQLELTKTLLERQTKALKDSKDHLMQ
jgi:flagellar motility protein MotE (MotC chaperone)